MLEHHACATRQRFTGAEGRAPLMRTPALVGPTSEDTHPSPASTQRLGHPQVDLITCAAVGVRTP